MLHETFFDLVHLQKKKGMKRKAFFIISLVLISFAFTACDLLGGDCQVCRYKTDDGVSTTYYGDAEYCGEDLVAMKATRSVTEGGVTTSVECD